MDCTSRLTDELSGAFSIEKWMRLAQSIRRHRPDVVILVARKMPRLAELLQLDFGASALSITDIAIPFCARMLSGKRVAVVDDVINVGSTMQNAEKQAVACGAASCKMFALAAKNNSCDTCFRDIHLVDQEPMPEEAFNDFVRQVPGALQLMSKPYDMDFPLCKCSIRPPFSQACEIFSWFEKTFSNDFHVLTTELEARHSLARYSVDFPAVAGFNLKARFYFDFNTHTCNVVPMAIPREFRKNGTYNSDTWAGALWEQLVVELKSAPRESTLWEEEPYARAELFVHSIAFSKRVFAAVAPIVIQTGNFPFSLEDASLVFGPSAITQFVQRCRADLHECECILESLGSNSKNEEFNPLHSQLSEDEQNRIEQEGTFLLNQEDITGAFHSIFERLAVNVGATDPAKYSLEHPFSPKAISETHYLRLRVGFSYQDILYFFSKEISQALCCIYSVRSLISTLMDHCIDAGSLVPVIANYDGRIFRVYRKGENKFWDEEQDRALYAWSRLGKPLSLTRFAKLQAILSFSSQISTSLVPSAFERGNVGCLPPSIIDRTGEELSHFLLKSGKLEGENE